MRSRPTTEGSAQTRALKDAAMAEKRSRAERLFRAEPELTNAAIGERLRVSPDVVGDWRRAWRAA